MKKVGGLNLRKRENPEKKSDSIQHIYHSAAPRFELDTAVVIAHALAI